MSPAKAKSLEFKSKLNIGDPFDLNLPTVGNG